MTLVVTWLFNNKELLPIIFLPRTVDLFPRNLKTRFVIKENYFMNSNTKLKKANEKVQRVV